MIVLNERENININPIILTPSSIDLNKKIGVMKVAYDSAKIIIVKLLKLELDMQIKNRIF